MTKFLRGALAMLGSRWGRWVGACVLALAMCGTMVGAASRNSPTIDEPGHLVRGLAFWWTKDRAIHWPHPPVGQALATAGAAVAGQGHRKRIELRTADFRRTTYHYAGASYASMRRELVWARYGMAVLAALLGLGIFAWCRQRYDDATAWLSLFLYGTNTVLLAHAGLITTDFPIAAATMLAIMAVHHHISANKRETLIWVALAVGLLAVTKVSGLLIAALLAVPVLVAAARGQGPYGEHGPAKRVGVLLLEGLAVLLVMLFCINVVYLFDDTAMRVADILARKVPYDRFEHIEVMGKDRWIGKLPEGLRIPLPWTYLYSIDFVLAQGQSGHGKWFLGELRPGGIPGYFVMLLGAKLPLAILGLLALGGTFGLIHRRPSATTKLLVYFAVAFLMATFFARINIGVRHALPVVPVLSILAGRAAALAWSGEGFSKRITERVRLLVGRIVVGLACASAVGGVAMAYPHFVADFNLGVGGREGGHEISIVGEDWGQDFVDFASWAKEENVEKVDYVKTSGLRVMELQHLGVPIKSIGCGGGRRDAVVLIHLTTFVRQERCRAWLEKFERRHVINDHLLIYERK